MIREKTEHLDAVFINANGNPYKGRKRSRVSAPGRKTVRVAAPDEASAIVAAASAWGVRWQRYDVYAFARVMEE